MTEDTDLTYSASAPSGTLSGATVVHAISGRVRLRVLLLKEAPRLAGTLEATLKAQPGITGASVNQRCGSVTITYDPLRCTPDSLCAFLQPLLAQDIEAYEPLLKSHRALILRLRRQIRWIVAGCASLIVGIVLMALPILPGGIPFLLLSIYCFAKAIRGQTSKSRT
jgi:hypothetical protein